MVIKIAPIVKGIPLCFHKQSGMPFTNSFYIILRNDIYDSEQPLHSPQACFLL